MKRQKIEEIIQRSCVGILQQHVPAWPEGPVWTAVNPVPAKSKAVAGISKAMGLTKGWPDFLLIWQGSTILVEFKRPDGRIDPDQKKLHSALASQGVQVHVIKSIEGFIKLLDAHKIPCRIRPGSVNST